MKAAYRTSYGPPSVLRIRELERPIPTEGEALIHVRATTVNRTDGANLTARPFIMRFVVGFFRPKRTVPGTDVAGVVEECSGRMKHLSKNDRVFGFNDLGLSSQAEYCCVPADQLYPIPDELSFPEAVASLEGAHYAYAFLRRASLKTGQRVLINGATGAIGSALLQFVRLEDVHISAVCNTQNIELVSKLGADKIFDYSREDFTVEAAAYDYIFDAVGKSSFTRCRKLLKPGGRYITSELGPWAQHVFFHQLSGIMPSKKAFIAVPYSTRESIPYIIDRLKKGEFKPVIDREYALESIEDAYRYVISGRKTGNVILRL